MTKRGASFPASDLAMIPAMVLDWYDGHARSLPWRIGPADARAGRRADPYRVWLSEIMLQQTTVAAVVPRYGAFLRRWPSVQALADAPLEDVLSEWAGLGYYARARNLHACAQAVRQRYGGVFPDTEEALRALPGIGAYTAAAIAAIVFDRRAVVIDGNVERVMARLFAIRTPMPAAKPEIRDRAASIWPERRSGDFAQALMDLGATVCTPRAPACPVCPLKAWCRAAALDPERFPVKRARAARPTRVGEAFALFNRRGEVLLETRAPKGLLGGMPGLPGGAWRDAGGGAVLDRVHAGAPVRAPWTRVGVIEHVFTHFRLELDVFVADLPKGRRRPAGMYWAAPAQARLPTVMGKALSLACDGRAGSAATLRARAKKTPTDDGS